VEKAAPKPTETRKAKAQDEVRSRSRSLGNTGMSNDPEQSIRAVSFRGRKKPGPREWIVERAICKGHAFGIAAEECGRIGAGLFIVDSVGFALEGDGELSKDVLRFHKECLRPIKEAGATPHLIDHQAKVIKGEKYSEKQEFGSVYKTNSVRSSFQIRGAWDGNELTTTFTHRKTNFGPKVPAFSLRLLFGGGRVKVERLEEAVPNPDRGPSKKEQVFEAVEELGRATAETVARKTGISLQTVRNAVSELVSEGALKDTGEKQGRSRIVVTHSQTTKGTGTGTKAQASASGYQEAF
jgi:hypothetical protein